MFICIAGKNNISVDVLEYLNRRNRENLYQLGVVCNKDETGINTWQKSLRRYAKDIGVREYTLEEIYDVKEQIFLSLEFDQIIRVECFTDARLYQSAFLDAASISGRIYIRIAYFTRKENVRGHTT